MKTPFYQPRFTGGRFEEQSFPVDATPELVAYKSLIVDLAKYLYLQDHPERQRVPKGFAESFRLDIEQIDSGSAKPRLVSVMVGALALVGEGPSYFERARDLVPEGVDASEGALPENFPKELLSHFNHLGRTLHEGEALELPFPSSDRVAVLTPAKRKQLVLAANQVYEREVDLSGHVEEADFAKLSFRLRLSDGRAVTVSSLSEPFHDIVRSYNGLPQHQIYIKGIGVFDASDYLQKIIAIESLEGIKNFTLASQLDEIALLKNGWFEGGGVAPDADSLARVAEKLIADYPDNLPLPQVVPTQDGNLLLEWQAEGEPSLDIDLATSKASFHAFGVNAEDVERDFTLKDAGGWSALFAFLGENIRGQQA